MILKRFLLFNSTRKVILMSGCYLRIETVWQTDCVSRVWNQVVCSFVVSWFANKCQHSYFLCVFFTNRTFKTIPLTKRCLEKHYFEKTHWKTVRQRCYHVRKFVSPSAQLRLMNCSLCLMYLCSLLKVWNTDRTFFLHQFCFLVTLFVF